MNVKPPGFVLTKPVCTWLLTNKPKMAKWSDDANIVKKVAALLTTNLTSIQIACELGVSRHAFERFIKRHGLSNLATRRTKILNEQKRYKRSLLNGGEHERQAAR